jgi:hypothetical protein
MQAKANANRTLVQSAVQRLGLSVNDVDEEVIDGVSVLTSRFTGSTTMEHVANLFAHLPPGSSMSISNAQFALEYPKKPARAKKWPASRLLIWSVEAVLLIALLVVLQYHFSHTEPVDDNPL